MPKRKDIKKILIIGAGPIVIGQGCEFDYSGTQACLALKEAGYEIVLINSNAATIMNDHGLANKTYIEPLTEEFIEKIIIKEKPNALLPTVGGQTALNIAMKLARSGFLEEHNIEMIGARVESIEKAEDRQLFAEAMEKIGLKVPESKVVTELEEAREYLQEIGLPAIIRPSFTLGGTGGGIVYNIDEFEKIVVEGLNASPIRSVQIDKSVAGWKEYELEIMRDSNGNFLVICTIENLDPMGIHTGDSITVAPSMTLTDKEYQKMRDSAKLIIEEIGLETGGANVQFAVNPENGEQLVVEMNPRVSRSSALASKATGYPIAKVAALVAVGFTLDEIPNDCTEGIPAAFEPTMDYVVVKAPKFNFDKFPNPAGHELTTAMKSVGEAMGIGRSFIEALQKTLVSLENGIDGIYSKENRDLTLEELSKKKRSLLNETSKKSVDRLLKATDALRAEATVKEICHITKYDPWFIHQINNYIVEVEKFILKNGIVNKEDLFYFKKQGFSDSRIGFLTNKSRHDIYMLRKELRVLPVFKRVDSCSHEFPVKTNYMYSTYDGDVQSDKYQSECNPTNKKKVIIIGSGCNRIGQGIEFDYSCVHAATAVRELGYEAIMINCNPETVSTDYKTSDRLYFEPLDIEHVMNVVDAENKSGKLLGIIVQFGGQTSLKLVKDLIFYKVPILGTNPDSLDIAEDRNRFRDLIEELQLIQPQSIIVNTYDELKSINGKINFPILIRPSNVLGGRSMMIVYEEKQLDYYIDENPFVFENGNLLIDEFLEDAIEVDVDAISDGEDTKIAGIMEHIEEAGVHSGDSICITPPPYLDKRLQKEIENITIKLTKALKVVGLINIQMAIKNNKIYILEANPRGSRTIPFISKSSGIFFAKIATHIMCGKKLSDFDKEFKRHHKNYAVKIPVFPFLKFQNADFNLGPEMKSTGESMGLDPVFEAAFIKAFIGSNQNLPTYGKVLISVKDEDKNGKLLSVAKDLIDNDFTLLATFGTATFLINNGFECKIINKVTESRPNIVDLIINNEIALFINTSGNFQAVREGLEIRRQSMMRKIPCIRTISQAHSLIKAIAYYKNNEMTI